MAKERYDDDLANAGWEPDGTFSEHLAIGNKGDLCLIIPSWVGGSNDLVCEIHDVRRNVSYWVREIPSPVEAVELLQKHGGPPEEERGNSNKTG